MMAKTHTVGMDKLPSAAAQGEQASEPHHADGYIFTGTDPTAVASTVQTLEDTVRHAHWLTVTGAGARSHAP